MEKDFISVELLYWSTKKRVYESNHAVGGMVALSVINVCGVNYSCNLMSIAVKVWCTSWQINVDLNDLHLCGAVP